MRSFFTPSLSFFLLLNLAFPSSAFSQAPPPATGWQAFERKVRDGAISRQEGEEAVADWADRLEREFIHTQFQKDTYFPLEGYSVKDVGGANGDGYKPKGYRFLDGNKHRGHPAQDIFVRDHDQDGIDDLTGKPVNVLALAEAIVLSTFSDWKKADPSCEIRGGNYIWTYHPALSVLSYYAHLETIFVRPGDRIQAGEPIATLGRSGKNACLPRSPTHLHLMVLSLKGMEPLDPYPLWRSASIIR